MPDLNSQLIIILKTLMFLYSEQRELTGIGSRPKTSAGIQLLLKSIMSEVESLRQRNQTWLQSELSGNKQDVTQVGAILADLERKLNDVMQGIAETKKMWEVCRRNGSAHSQRSLRSGGSRGNRASSDEFQLPAIKEIKRQNDDNQVQVECDSSDVKSSQSKCNFESRVLKRRESTCMQPTKQRSNRTRQKLMELQTKGMTPEQLRNYYRERSFLNSVSRRGSLHADADKRLLERLDSGSWNFQTKFAISKDEVEEPVKQYRGDHNRNSQTNMPSWTKEGIMGYRRETTLHFIRNGNSQSLFKKKGNLFSKDSEIPGISTVGPKVKDSFLAKNNSLRKPETM